MLCSRLNHDIGLVEYCVFGSVDVVFLYMSTHINIHTENVIVIYLLQCCTWGEVLCASDIVGFEIHGTHTPHILQFLYVYIYRDLSFLHIPSHSVYLFEAYILAHRINNYYHLPPQKKNKIHFITTMAQQTLYTDSMARFATDTRTQLRNVLTRVHTFTTTRSKTFWIVVGIVFTVVIGLGVYYAALYRYYWHRYVDCPGCYLRYPDQNANIIEREPIDSRLITQPQSGYTYSLWLYVANWYNSRSYNKWKPLYCRADIPHGCGELEWDKVPFQQPGIWLAPNQNTARIVVTTSTHAPNTSAPNCKKMSNNSDKQDTAGAETHSSHYNMQCPVAGGNGVHSGPNIHILEYIDLYDIPIGQWFHLCVVVTPQRVELYMNGKLARTHVLVGSCDISGDRCTTENGYFAPGTTHYTARLSNFRYMPRPIPAAMVQLLHDTESNNPILATTNPLNPISGDGNRFYYYL